ncbi:hypothetical protein JHK85_018128 [Glycine max]|uniref:Uncharacterized protein n=1 Tax=Glycine soja TaxID=3848 RepID=A0A0B2R5Q7_GLYSO|nr:hypothetical protein JHK85_018128 [Glycine max]KAG5036899.1 hypothetical protein JHK86_017739 [Glycine max]KHN27263.1 hypothetical protein glysoja_041821 [Glycine soja]
MGTTPSQNIQQIKKRNPDSRQIQIKKANASLCPFLFVLRISDAPEIDEVAIKRADLLGSYQNTKEST